MPLSAPLRTMMKAGFGHDFSEVRVHADEHAGDAARSLNARAFTVGSNVVFAHGAFAPQTRDGLRLVAHELAHVVQQGGRMPTGSSSDDAGERTARQAAEVVAAGGRARVAPLSVAGPQRCKDRAGRGAALPPALTPEEMWTQLVQSKRGFESSSSGPGDTHRSSPATLPPGSLHLDEAGNPTAKGALLGKGYETFAAVQVVGAQGKRVAVAADSFQGGGPDNHAEARCVETLKSGGPARLDGGKLVVVSDQTVCPSCRQKLIDYAESRGLTVIEPHEAVRPKMVGSGDASSKTTSRSSTQAARPELTVTPREPIPVTPSAPPARQVARPTTPRVKPPAPPRQSGSSGQLRAEVGERPPLRTPFEGTPGFNSGMRGAHEGAALMLHQGMVAHIQQHQLELAEQELKAKQPAIDEMRRRGLWVIASVVMSEPRSVDLLRGIFTTPDQIATFRFIMLRSGDTRAEAENPPSRIEAAPANVRPSPIKPLPESRVSRSYDVAVYPPIEPPKPGEGVWPGGEPVKNMDLARRFVRVMVSLRDQRLGPPGPLDANGVRMQFVPYDLDKPQVQQDLAILVALFRLKPDERRLIAEAFGPNVLKIADKLSANQGGWRP